MNNFVQFKTVNRHYYLESEESIIQIVETNSQGIDRFVKDFLSVRRFMPEYQKSLVIDKFHYDGLLWIDKFIGTDKFDFDVVIIKDADHLMNSERSQLIKDYIAEGHDTFWILIGDCYFSCVPTKPVIGNMTKSKSKKDDLIFYTMEYFEIDEDLE